MSLTVSALLVDPQAKPLANCDAQVVMFTMAGAARSIGTGRSGADGRLSVVCNFTAPAGADFQPRIQLQLKRGTAFVEASENPKSFDGASCDMGTVTFNPSLPTVQLPPVVLPAPTPTTTLDLPTLQLQISTLTTAKTNLETQVSQLSSQTNQLTTQRNTALADLSKVQTDLSKAQIDLVARDQLIQQKDATIADKTAAYNNLQTTYQNDLKARDATIADKTVAYNNLQTTYQNELKARDAAIADKTVAYNNLQTTYQNDLKARDATIADKTVAYNNLQTTYQNDLKARDATIADKTATLAALQARLNAMSNSQLPLDQLTHTTATALNATQTRLAADRSSFQLGKVSLQLKVLAGAGGQVGVLDADEIVRVGSNALSQVSMEFHPPAASTASASASSKVPQLLGYTESLARRKLAELRLNPEVVYQLVSTDEKVGTVVRQIPAAGSAIDAAANVVLAVGKKG